MTSGSRPAIAAQIQARLPRDVAERLRLLMLWLAIASTLLVVPSVLLNTDAPPLQRGLALILVVVMVWRWIGWNRTGHTHRADLLLEAVAVISILSTVGNPLTALWFVYSGMFYRPHVASNRETACATTVYLAAVWAGITINAWSIYTVLSPGILVHFPAIILVAITVRIVAVTLERNSMMTSELRQMGRSYRTLIEQLPGAVLISDKDANLEYMSPRIRDILGYEPNSYVGLRDHWLQRIHAEDRERVLNVVRSSLETGTPIEFECRAIHQDGSVVWIRVESLRIDQETDTSEKWRGIVTDVTEQHRLADQLVYQAFHDQLTGLPNRARFEERLAHTLDLQSRRAASHAVLFLDLDQFKVVNDSLGHHAGDQLLVDASVRILDCVREGDTVARVGGDEFAILLEDFDSRDEALSIATELVESLSEPFLLNEHPIHTSVSVGITFTDDASLCPNDLVRRADVAMYVAKRNGRARYAVFEPEMDKQVWERLQLEADLRDALERHEFEVYYQPVVDLTTGTVPEIEALVRWQHPRRGIIQPGDFLPVAEETGLIATLDRWVLRQACFQARDWQHRFASHADLTVCVNLSPELLREPSLASYVADVLETSGLAPHNLKLEVTEHAMLADIKQGHQALIDLHALGVHIAIDDFGTGNSALSYLRQLPVDTLKIDRSYVADIDGSPESMRMIAAVITLAKSLGLIVTAEGIEHRHQTTLQAIGCDLGQGFYFDRPLPAMKVEEILCNPDGYEDHLELPTHKPVFTFVNQPVSQRTSSVQAP